MQKVPSEKLSRSNFLMASVYPKWLKLYHRLQEAVHLTMALRRLCMMGVGHQVRVVHGTPTIQTHHHGKKNQEIITQPFPQAIMYINRNLSPSFSGLTMILSSAMMMSPRHLLRVTVGRPTLRLPVTQKCPPHRSTPSTTLRLLELLPCECSFIYVC